MPFYTFKCTKCNAITDELVKIGTESTTCDTCGAQRSSSQVSALMRTGFRTASHPIGDHHANKITKE